MKKNFKLYIIAWAVILALFNIIAFVVPSIPSFDKYTASFWIGYVFITLTFAGQLICSYITFKTNNSDKLFYHIPLVTVSYASLIVSFIIGGLFMILSFLPYWIGAIICAIVFAVNVVIVITVKGWIDEVIGIDKKIKEQTIFVKSLTVEADTLIAKAKSDIAKKECKRVYEAIRYSDPMSHEALNGVEREINGKISELSYAVDNGNDDEIKAFSAELLILIKERNSKCKLYK